MKKKTTVIFSLSLLLAVFVFINAYSAAMQTGAPKTAQGKIRLNISDCRTDMPVHNACIIILETNEIFYSDNNGNSPYISVPVNIDARFNSVEPKNYGEISILIYKEGYIDCFLLNIPVKPESISDNISVLMQVKTPDSPAFVTVCESPDDEWIERIFEKYR